MAAARAARGSRLATLDAKMSATVKLSHGRTVWVDAFFGCTFPFQKVAGDPFTRTFWECPVVFSFTDRQARVCSSAGFA